MANKFKEKQVRAELLAELYDIVERKEKDLHEEYTVIGKSTIQAKDWRTGELLWEDEAKTIPVMRDEYGTVPKEELSEEDKLRSAVYKDVMEDLGDLL